MKALLVNGSPRKNGCTNRALEEVAKTLKEEGIDSEIFWIGNKPISGCIDCGQCPKLGKCAIDDVVNEFSEKAKDFDAYVFGAPVYYASANGSTVSFMDRLFFSNHYGNTGTFYMKPAAAVTSARRAGTTATLDQLNKYFLLMGMPVVSAGYWNMVHGQKPEEVEQDLEGLQNLRILARHMAFILKVKEAGLAAGVKLPQQEEVHLRTNFIR